MSCHLILGGARSGKSGYAQRLAEAHGGAVDFVATAEILDAEMAERIARHRAERPAHWQLTEAPVELPAALRSLCQPGRCVLVDCLTLWLSNILCTRPDELETHIDELCAAIQTARGSLLLVSNEVGWSIVPENALARRFRDEQGRLNQRVAALAHDVTLVAAGLPLKLKETRG